MKNFLSNFPRRKNNLSAAIRLFFRRRIADGKLVGPHLFSPLLSLCSSVSLLRQLHALVIRSGCTASPITSTSLLDSYSKFGVLNDAVKVFDEMSLRDVVSWNALLSCYTRHGRLEQVFTAFHKMKAAAEGFRFTGFTLCTLLKACVSLRAFQTGKQIHGLITVAGHESVVLSTALIELYSSCGAVREAVEVFEILSCSKDVGIYNALIGGYIQNQLYKEAISLVREVEPNCATLTCALSVCSETLDIAYGRQIHCAGVFHGFMFDTIFTNALVNMYAKCGDVRCAHCVFDRIVEKTVVSWTSIIDAYGNHGKGLEALELFSRMQTEESANVKPNEITFLSVLSACAHSGLVDEGKDCFLLMNRKYGLCQTPEHYACLIDLLGRAGKIMEAWDLFCIVSTNPSNLTTGICVAMLGACRISMDASRGETVGRYLLELDPDNAGSYVLLSNFFAAIGSWEKVENMRKLMRNKGLEKNLGNSQITMKHMRKQDWRVTT